VVLVAEEEGALLGFASGHPCYDSGESRWGYIMNDLYVAPESRRQGLGRALVAGLAAEAARDGGEYLWWDADEADEPALAFHRGIGAVEQRVHAFSIGGADFARLAE